MNKRTSQFFCGSRHNRIKKGIQQVPIFSDDEPIKIDSKWRTNPFIPNLRWKSSKKEKIRIWWKTPFWKIKIINDHIFRLWLEAVCEMEENSVDGILLSMLVALSQFSKANQKRVLFMKSSLSYSGKTLISLRSKKH